MSTVVLPEVVSCLDAICKQVFVMLADMDAVSLHIPGAATCDVACQISIKDGQGASSDLVIRASDSFAKRFTQGLFNKPAEDVTDIEVIDAIKELANTLGGNLKGIIEAETSLSIPEIVTDLHSCRPAVLTRLGYCFVDARECVVELCAA